MTQFLYAANSGDKTVSLISLATNAVLRAAASIGSTILDFVVTPDGKTLYALTSGNLKAVNLASGAVTNIAMANVPNSLVLTPDGAKLYVALSSSNALSVVSTATNAVTATVTVGSRPFWVGVSPDGTKLYSLNYADSTVSVVSTSTDTVQATVSLPAGTGGYRTLFVSASGSELYLPDPNNQGAFQVVNTGTNAVSQFVVDSTKPLYGIAFVPGGTKAFVNQGAQVSVIDTGAKSVSSTFTLSPAAGQGAKALLVSPDGTKLFVSTTGASGISVFSAVDSSAAGTVTDAQNPYLLAAASFFTSAPGPLTIYSDPTPTTIDCGTPASLGAGNTSLAVQYAPDASGSPGTYATFGTGYAASTQVHINGLSPYTLYWVRAVGQGGPNGDQAGPATQTRTLFDMPSVTFGTDNSGQTVPVLIPAYPADVTAWDLQEQMNGTGGAWTTVQAGIAPSSTYAGPVAPGNYYWRLVGTENGVAGVAGPAASYGTSSVGGGGSTPPSAPAAPTFGPPGQTTAPVISPALPANASSLTLQRAPDAGGVPGTFTTLATGLAGGATYNDSGLTQTTTYWYRCIAVGPGGTATGPYASDMTTAPETAPPTFSSASVNAAGTAVTWIFGDPYAGNTLAPAAPTGLSITVSGVNVPLGAASATGLSVVTPVASGTIASGATVLGSYAPGNLTDAASPPNSVAAFTNQPVANNSAVAAPLTVALTAPAAGATVTGVQAFTAAASGGVMGVAKVELYVGGSLVDSQGVGASGVYTLHWDTTAAGNGPYSVYAKAYDNATPPNTAVSAALSVTASNPDRLGTGYFFTPPLPAAPGGTIKTAVITADILPGSDQRSLRELLFGVTTSLGSTNFEADYTLVALNEDFALPSPSTQYRIGVKLAQRYTVGGFNFTEQIVKMRVLAGTAGAATSALIWAASGKLYSFDGISAPALLLDTAPLLLAGETLRDVCAFGGRVFLALSGGPAPLASRLFAYDPAAGDESYTVAGFLGTASALAATATALYIGTTEGYAHSLSASGVLKKVCGGTTPALPHGVAMLKAVELSGTNTMPGVTAILTDGSAWDLDGTAQYGATEIILPPDGAATAACIADETYVGSAGGGLYGRGSAGYTLAYTFPHGVGALAGYGGTVYAGLSADGRLWGKTLSPGAHALAFGPVTDPLGKTSSLAGLTSITALLGIGGGLYAGGTAGAGEVTLYEYQAPAASALGLFGQAFKHPALEVRSFQ